MSEAWHKAILRRVMGRKKEEPAHLAAGRWGEEIAGEMLCKKGYKIVERRLKILRDEIDLIVRRRNILVFVEVKTRRSVDFGRPVEAVKRPKQKNLCRAAVRYLKAARVKPEYIRFDVVEVIGQPEVGEPKVNHIENAFPLGFGYRLPW